jgi:predicted AlkP superfamily phosphohydrolase/phosphomutase
LGLNQLFLNLRGREVHGVVPPERRAVVLRRLARELESWRDVETGEVVITRVVEPGREHFPDRAPDLLVGYNRGYRSSDESALGRVTDTTLEPNLGKWSGDHCMDPAHVPGVLFSTAPLGVERASLTDMAPTILSYFGLSEAAQTLPGTSILAE